MLSKAFFCVSMCGKKCKCDLFLIKSISVETGQLPALMPVSGECHCLLISMLGCVYMFCKKNFSSITLASLGLGGTASYFKRRLRVPYFLSVCRELLGQTLINRFVKLLPLLSLSLLFLKCYGKHLPYQDIFASKFCSGMRRLITYSISFTQNVQIFSYWFLLE